MKIKVKQFTDQYYHFVFIKHGIGAKCRKNKKRHKTLSYRYYKFMKKQIQKGLIVRVINPFKPF